MTYLDIVRELKIPYRTEGHEHCRRGWLQVDCNWCSPHSEHFRLGISLSRGFCNCWACGPHRLGEALSLAAGVPMSLVLGHLKGVPRQYTPQTRTKGKLKLPKGVGRLLGPHNKYLRKRGYDPYELARLWGIGGIGMAADLSWRIYIPVYHEGQVVSYTTRSISDKHKNRYRSAAEEDEAIPHKDLLYGEDYVRHTVIVVEGPLDVWKIGPGAVGTFGTGFSPAQVEKISKYPKRTICFDNEPTAQQLARELCDQLEPFPGETINVVLDAKDPGVASTMEILQLRHDFLE